MKTYTTILLMLFTLALTAQVGVQVGTSDSKIMLGVDKPMEVRVQALAFLGYNYSNNFNFGVKFGYYAGHNRDHLIGTNLRFFGSYMKGQMITLSYEYNIRSNIFIGVEASVNSLQATVAYYLPYEKVGKGCY